MAGRISIPGTREILLDARGNVSPRWRRYFEELGGSGANTGDVLVITDNGPAFDPGSTSTISEDIEFLEHWRS